MRRERLSHFPKRALQTCFRLSLGWRVLKRHFRARTRRKKQDFGCPGASLNLLQNENSRIQNSNKKHWTFCFNEQSTQRVRKFKSSPRVTTFCINYIRNSLGYAVKSWFKPCHNNILEQLFWWPISRFFSKKKPRGNFFESIYLRVPERFLGGKGVAETARIN